MRAGGIVHVILVNDKGMLPLCCRLFSLPQLPRLWQQPSDALNPHRGPSPRVRAARAVNPHDFQLTSAMTLRLSLTLLAFAVALLLSADIAANLAHRAQQEEQMDEAWYHDASWGRARQVGEVKGSPDSGRLYDEDQPAESEALVAVDSEAIPETGGAVNPQVRGFSAAQIRTSRRQEEEPRARV